MHVRDISSFAFTVSIKIKPTIIAMQIQVEFGFAKKPSPKLLAVSAYSM